MKFEADSPRTHGDNAVIPLINVVFLILIFLVITGQITNSDVYKVELPESVSQSTPPDITQTLIVNEERQLYLNNQATNLSELPDRLRELDDVSQITDIKLLIKADAGLPVSDLRPVLTSLREAGLQRVLIATIQG